MRRNYDKNSLDESNLHSDPMEQFKLWFDEAITADFYEPNAMTLATATANGIPSARVVLLKGIVPEGFRFFTNHLSRKGNELTENPHAAILFYWDKLERQIRIEGKVEQTSRKVATEYFHSRPRGAQLAATVSRQSQITTSRTQMEQELNQKISQSNNGEIPLPDHWGGYTLTPTKFEFWQGRENRFHDRIVYTKLNNQTWTISRLWP